MLCLYTRYYWFVSQSFYQQVLSKFKIQQVQRQLQLRIEAQGKYLKKIIEEQHRLSGAVSEVPGSGLSAPALNDNWPSSDMKTDPATPAPTSETPLLDKSAKENALAKSTSIDESFSSRHEPLTPDSGCHSSSPDESRSAKKQRASMDAAYSIPETVLTHQILDSSCSPQYKQPHSLLLAREQLDHFSRIPISNEDQFEDV